MNQMEEATRPSSFILFVTTLPRTSYFSLPLDSFSFSLLPSLRPSRSACLLSPVSFPLLRPSRHLSFSLTRYQIPHRIIWLLCLSDILLQYSFSIITISICFSCLPLLRLSRTSLFPLHSDIRHSISLLGRFVYRTSLYPSDHLLYPVINICACAAY
jgi:hypothetical protein